MSQPSTRLILLRLGAALGLTLVAWALTAKCQFGMEKRLSVTDVKLRDGQMFTAFVPKGFGAMTSGPLFYRLDSAVLLEDGRPLAHPAAPNASIEKVGRGQYRITPVRVLFSSSDGTPPDRNGRNYAVAVPFFVAPIWLLILTWMACLATWITVVGELGYARRLRAFLLPDSTARGRGTIMESLCDLLLPYPFFIGVLLALVLCSIVGRRAAMVDVYYDRDRFFLKISPEGSVYPTLQNLEAFVRGKASPYRILVLVGGSSIPLGVGQANAHLWTNLLQEDLGGDYRVVNVSFRAALAPSILLPLADALRREYPRAIFVSDMTPYKVPGFLSYEKGPYSYPYDYVVWQAWVNGSLSQNPARDAALFDAIASRDIAIRMHSQEQFIHAVLEKIFASSNLWNEIGYRHFFTVYSPLAPDKTFYAPRSTIIDDQPPTPPSEGATVRDWPHEYESLQKLFLNRIRTNADGSLSPVVPDAEFSASMQKLAPDPGLRARILLLVTSRSPAYIARLDSREKVLFQFAVTDSARAYRKAGFDSIPLGLDYSAEDFSDPSHFSDAAAPKMAKDVANEIRRMAQREGWTNEKP
jgi:hypothetical protein